MKEDTPLPVPLLSSYDIEAGDVLLFKPPFEEEIRDKLITGFIQFTATVVSHQNYGDTDTVHAAICIGHKGNHIPWVAHLTGHGICCAKHGRSHVSCRKNSRSYFYSFSP